MHTCSNSGKYSETNVVGELLGQTMHFICDFVKVLRQHVVFVEDKFEVLKSLYHLEFSLTQIIFYLILHNYAGRIHACDGFLWFSLWAEIFYCKSSGVIFDLDIELSMV